MKRKNTKNSTCVACGKRKVCSIGNGRFSNLCRTCRWYKWSVPGTIDYLSKRQKDAKCEKCGFIPEHSCQLAVDRIEPEGGNDITNLELLCLNCKALKQQTQKNPQ